MIIDAIELGSAMLHKIEPSAFRRMRWKDGGGETAEIAIGPPGSSVANFDWRISTARVSTAGPFSIFPGIDRSLIVLSGIGLELYVTEANTIRRVLLDTESDAFFFAGDAAVAASPIDHQPIVDFNVMTRRGRYTHTIQKMCITSPLTLTANRVALYGLSGTALCRVEQPHLQTMNLSPEQVVIIEPSDDQDLTKSTVSIEPSGQTLCRIIAVMLNQRSHANG